MKLFTMEMRRFWTRRATLAFAGAGIVFLIATLAVLAANTHAPTAAELAEAQQTAIQNQQQVEVEHDRCVQYQQDPEGFAKEHGEPSYPEEFVDEYTGDCDDDYDPSFIEASDYLVGVLSFASETQNQIAFLGIVFIVCGLLIAGSFIGAEWTSGGMTNLLLWQPRRMRLFTAKLSAAVVGVVCLTIAYSLIHLTALWGLASVKGQVGDLNGTWWSQNLEFAGRLLAIVVLVTICAVALAMLGRRTVAAIGTVIGYGVAIEYGIRTLAEGVTINVELGLLSTYLQAWFTDGVYVSTTFYYPSAVGYEDGLAHIFISPWTGGGVLLAVTAALTVLAAFSFHRRDTT